MSYYDKDSMEDLPNLVAKVVPSGQDQVLPFKILAIIILICSIIFRCCNRKRTTPSPPPTTVTTPASVITTTSTGHIYQAYRMPNAPSLCPERTPISQPSQPVVTPHEAGSAAAVDLECPPSYETHRLLRGDGEANTHPS